MFKVVIYKNKFTSVSWDDKIQDWVETTIDKKTPITKFFDLPVEVKENVTVEDFMKFLGRYKKDIDYCFAGYMNELSLDVFLEEIKKDGVGMEEVKEVEIYWFGEIMGEVLNIVGALRSWITKEAGDKKGISSDVPYSIEFTPISILKKAKLILNDNIIITDFGEVQSMQETIVFDGFKAWTLHDLISNFLFELTANGTPDEVFNLMKDLAEKKYDVHEIAKDKEQSKFWLGFLESQITDFETEIKVALDEEKYEIVATLKKDLEDAKQELGDLRREISKINNATKSNEPEAE